MRVAVVGAGWAGLAAAADLLTAGVELQVFEAAASPGGRARAIYQPRLQMQTDNGQHIMLGAYSACLALMRRFGASATQSCHIESLDLASAAQDFRLRLLDLPAPWHFAGALFASHGLDGIAGRAHLLRVLLAARKHPQIAATTGALAWLRAHGATATLLENLWRPLALAAANTPLETLAAQTLARVLHDSFGGPAANSSVYINRVSLHGLWAKPLCDLLAARLKRARIGRLEMQNGAWLVNHQEFDRVILAVPQPNAWQLLAGLPQAARWLARYSELEYAPIATLSLLLERPLESGRAMLMLGEDPAKLHLGQWLFDRSASASEPAEQNLLQVIIGRQRGLAPSERLARAVYEQIGAQIARPLPALRAWSLVNEKRATFDAVTELRRPGPRTPWRGLFLAGDWTDTGYPAVLEGAVRSGQTAAALAIGQD